MYKLNLSSCRSATADKLIVNSSVHSTSHDHVVKLRQCYYGNCTCDSSTASSDNQRIILILAIICGSLFILVLLILLIICYK